MTIATWHQFTCTGHDTYEIDTNGMACGAEWSDEFGNMKRMIWVDSPVFSPRVRFSAMVYNIFIKPVGLDIWIYDKSQDIVDNIDDSKYFNYNPMSADFGKLELEPFNEQGELKEGLITQAQFMCNMFIYNKLGLVLSFRDFIAPFIGKKQNVTF